MQIRLLVVAPTTVNLRHPDTRSYLNDRFHSVIETVPFFQKIRWQRPPVYPLFLRLCSGVADLRLAQGLQRAVNLQLILSGLAFGGLALVLFRRCVRTLPAGIAVVGFLALLSISVYSGPWDELIMTESLAVSLFVALLAGLLEFWNRPSKTWLALCAAILILAAGIRDANAFIPVCLIPFCGMGILPKKKWKTPCIALCLVALGSWSWLSSIKERRLEAPLTNVLSKEILSDEGNFDLFVQRYELPPRFKPLVGKLYYDGWAGDREYLDWLHRRGRFAYLSFLLSHPAFVEGRLHAAIADRARELADAPSLVAYFDPEGIERLGGSRRTLCWGVTWILSLPFLITVRLLGAYALWGVLIFTIGWSMLSLKRKRNAALAALFGFLLLNATTQSLSASFLDAMEDHRHALLADFSLILLFYLGAITALLEPRLSRGSTN